MKLNKKLDLSGFDYMMYNHCTFCESTDVVEIEKIHTNPEVHYFSCHTCKVSYTDKQLSAKSTQDLYLNYFDDHLLKTGIESDVLGKHLFNFFSSKNNYTKSLKILDYGGGDGSIAKHLSEKLKEKYNLANCIVDVYDVYECEQKIAGINYLKQENEIGLNNYDIVIASAVLEHLNTPMETLRLLFTSLKPKGYLYARTPFKIPLRGLLFKLKIKKIGLQFPWHLFDMGRLFWNNLPHLFLGKFGIKIKVVKSQPSIVQTSYKENAKKRFISKLFKIPGYIFEKWNYVGGWEVFIEKMDS